jgi:hypothetical protein
LPATHVRVGTDPEHFSEAHCLYIPDPPINELTRAVRPRVAVKLQWLTWSRQLPFGPGIHPYPASYARRLLKEAALRPGFL